MSCTIFDLPSELLDGIFRQVSRQSLKQLALSCRHFNSIAVPQIWHTVEIKDRCSQRRDAAEHGYNATVAPEQDPDADLIPGSPIRWGDHALSHDNPRRARLAALAPADPTNPVPAPIDLERNPLHPREIMEDVRRQRDARYSKVDLCTNALGLDQHDDTPAIRKLYLLASRPKLAAYVRVLWHRCHLATPDMSTELMWMCCAGQTLSSDWRTLTLLRLAIQNMVNVTALKFTMPHWNIYYIMVSDFMDRSRQRERSVSKLWFETCSAIWDAHMWPRRCDFGTIRSIRFRRLKLFEDFKSYGKARSAQYPPFYLARTGPPVRLRNGHGGMLYTSTHSIDQDQGCSPQLRQNSGPIQLAEHLSTKCLPAHNFDEYTYMQLPEIKQFVQENQVRAQMLPPLSDNVNHTGYVRDCPMNQVEGRRMIRWLRCNFHHLTHLNFDWLVLRKSLRTADDDNISSTADATEALLFSELSKLRIKTLRSFQLRNALNRNSALPRDVYLLTPKRICVDTTGDDVHFIDFLSFLENHPDLTCLAWPMDAFLEEKLWSDGKPQTDLEHDLAKHAVRVRAVLDRLGRMLETLRIDCMFQVRGEPQSELLDTGNSQQKASCHRRRLFIYAVASRMRNVTTLKVEGHVPRDEKRELLRAMSRCPLRHFVSIGRTFPLGNSWGVDATLLEQLEGESFHSVFSAVDNFEADDYSMFHNDRSWLPTPGQNVQIFRRNSGTIEPQYGWLPSEPPLLFHLATFFKDTITELKFCGSSSAIVYGHPFMESPNVTGVILGYLKYFPNLRDLILSYYMPRDTRISEGDVILSWLYERDALWFGKDESFASEMPNAESDEVNWSDLSYEVQNPDLINYPGQVDREHLKRVINDFRDVKVIQHALRRAYIWDKHWSIHSSIEPFPGYPNFDPYSDDYMTLDESSSIQFGLTNNHLGVDKNVFGAKTGDRLDRAQMIVIQNMAPISWDQQPTPIPSEVFAPFNQSHYFKQWLNSFFLIEPMEPDQIILFWKHLAASLQLLRYRLSPIRMAEQIYAEMRPYLSPVVLARPSGLKFRASFCVGIEASDIFDLDILMDNKGVKRFWGPRPEADWGRWREKNDARRYF